MIRKIFVSLMLCLAMTSCSESLGTVETISDEKIETNDVETNNIIEQNIETNSSVENIENHYDSLYPFTNEDGLMGYIDKTGLVKIDPTYKNAESFNEGLAVVQSKDADFRFYIDANGYNVFDKAFYNAFAFSEGLAVTFESENKMVIINNSGEVVYERDNVLHAEKYNDGMLLFRDKNGKYGFLDNNGEIVAEPIYENALEFSEDLAAVMSTDGFIDYIDENGNVMLETNYFFDPLIQKFQFKNGLACVSNESGKYGYIDKNGEVKIDFVYDNARAFNDEYAAVQLEGGMFAFIDINGTLAFDNTFFNVGDFSEGVASVSDNIDLEYGKIGFINTKGELIIDYKYSYGYSAIPSLFPSNTMNNGLIQVKKEDENDSWIGYINSEDEVIIKTIWNENLFK